MVHMPRVAFAGLKPSLVTLTKRLEVGGAEDF